MRIQAAAMALATAAVLGGCNAAPVPEATSPAGAEAEPHSGDVKPTAEDLYAIRDTAEWECGGNSGWFGTARLQGTRPDSIELSFGVHALADGIAFMPMLAIEEAPELFFICPGDPLYQPREGERRLLAEVLPLFDPGFPALLSTDSTVTYWGFRGNRVYAVRYDAVRLRADATFLVESSDLRATDNRYQFLAPRKDGSDMVFQTWPGLGFRLDAAMRVVSVDTVRH